MKRVFTGIANTIETGYNILRYITAFVLVAPAIYFIAVAIIN